MLINVKKLLRNVNTKIHKNPVSLKKQTIALADEYIWRGYPSRRNMAQHLKNGGNGSEFVTLPLR
jgi:hypothetical protein